MNREILQETTLHAYADGELDSDSKKIVKAWLQDHPDDKDLLNSWKKQIDYMKATYNSVLNEPLPDGIQQILQSGNMVVADNENKVHFFKRNNRFVQTLAASILLLVSGGTVGWFSGQMQVSPTQVSLTKKETLPILAVHAINSHIVYTSDTERLVEVSASEGDLVRAWVNKRIGKDISVPDFSALGFQFLGIRIVPMEEKAAALLVYQNTQKETITLFLSQKGANQSEKTDRFWAKENVKCFFWFGPSLGIALTGEISKDRLIPLKYLTKQHFTKA